MKVGKILNVPSNQECPDYIFAVPSQFTRPQCALSSALADQATDGNALDTTDAALNANMLGLKSALEDEPNAKENRLKRIRQAAEGCTGCVLKQRILNAYINR